VCLVVFGVCHAEAMQNVLAEMGNPTEQVANIWVSEKEKKRIASPQAGVKRQTRKRWFVGNDCSPDSAQNREKGTRCA